MLTKFSHKNMILCKKPVLLLIGVLLITSKVHSQLSLAKIFSDQMVLQCDVTVPIWGKASPNSDIMVSFEKEEFHGNSDAEGKWKIEIPAHRAGTTGSITVSNMKDRITLENVVFGDVWLCGGQSNMEWYLEGADNPQEEISKANYPNIRLFDVPRRMETLPASDLVGGKWQLCSPSTVSQFSAVGYFFGRTLVENTERPIGLLGNNYGGTIAETWTSEEGLSEIGFFDESVADFKQSNLDELRTRGDIAFNEWLSKFQSEDVGMDGSEYLWATKEEHSTWSEMQLPTMWESAHDTSLYEKDGVVWFTKEFEIESVGEAMLSLGPIDDSDITWINGVRIGETNNQFNKDRKYQVKGSVLVVGTNIITVRVEDYLGGGGLYGSSDKLYIQINGEKLNLSGAWKYKTGMIVQEPMPTNSFGPNNFPTCLYNGMVHPIIDFPIKGVIWYQGESNSYRAYEYKRLFPLLINDWRSKWKQPELPFIFVQLANFGAEVLQPKESQWAELREAQEGALSLSNTAMITTIDIGEGNNIHPTNKQEVGRRLANAALTEVYGKSMVYKGPTFKKLETKEAYLEVTYEDVGDGLKVEDKHGYVYGYSIAGKDGKYKWAKAEIIGKNKVRVWSIDVSNPTSIRYAWQDNPEPANLKNSYNLPAFPFRTDDHELSTFKIKRF